MAMNKLLFRSIIILLLLSASLCYAQKAVKYDLQTLLKNGQLATYRNQNVTPLTDDALQGISLQGIVWLKGVNFSTGSIDLDIRGKDIFQQSFVGIAFHGVDTITYESIYFRPFNFQSPDSLRRKHTVQYICQPDYPWDRLRKEHPLVYESMVTPMPTPTSWFHAHIVVTSNEVTVYVNHSPTPSLKIKRLTNRGNGLMGLWSSALSGDFADLVISK